MFFKISQNSQENTCPGVSTYQFNSQSMDRPYNAEAVTGGVLQEKVFLKI